MDNYFASEINEDSIKVAKHNYPNTIHIGDVTELDDEFLRTLPKIDLLIGGSPCQGLSKAKSNRENLNDPRSKLFFNYVDILNWIRKHNNSDVKFLLENVKPNSETIEVMNEFMGCDPIEINSVLVSAQRRIRLYWTNIEGIQQPEDKGLKIRDIIYDMKYKNFKDERIDASKVHTKNYVKWDISQKGHYSQQDRAYYLDGTMCTLMKSNPMSKLNIYLENDLYKRCHPVEAERLQTLPDHYTSIIPSDSKRLGVIGDGWTADVVSHIFSFMK